MPEIPVVDLFSGPGGLGEGLHQADLGFRTVAAFEMDHWAHQTLTLRAAFHELERSGSTPDAYFDLLQGGVSFEQAAKDKVLGAALSYANQAHHQLELGPETRPDYSLTIESALRGSSDFVLIGGPPCQAYSLVGRARRKNDLLFAEDKKHFLYREYLEIIRRLSPAVFVMENVKGLLSSTHSGDGMFRRIFDDLTNPGGGADYDLYSLVSDGPAEALRPTDFVIRAEQYGVPQRRHRVILVGVRRGSGLDAPSKLKQVARQSTVRDAIGDLPRIRSGVSRGQDSWEVWSAIRRTASSRSGTSDSQLELKLGAEYVAFEGDSRPNGIGALLRDDRIGGAVQHASRRHMAKDLERYYFAAEYTSRHLAAPRLKDFPVDLLPAHANAGDADAPFSDRFNVQAWDRPSSTVVSHIAKDGHYYIHPDPEQMRSLTVREAARLQTFPDNYWFRGPQTERYAQIGNAVPPLLARQIGTVVAQVFRSVLHSPQNRPL